MLRETQEQRIAGRMQRCIHFNGIGSEKCKAGVSYDDVTPIPCLGPRAAVEQANCTKKHLSTREQVVAELAEIDDRWSKTLKCANAAHEDAELKGLGVGCGGVSAMECPTGCGGTLNYQISGVNGHMHAACTTKGCFQWME